MERKNGNKPIFEKRLLNYVTHMRFNRLSKLTFVSDLGTGQTSDPVEHCNAVNLLLHANGVEGYRARVVVGPTELGGEVAKMQVDLVRNRCR